jgi:hypothetical protein
MATIALEVAPFRANSQFPALLLFYMHPVSLFCEVFTACASSSITSVVPGKQKNRKVPSQAGKVGW